MSLSNGAVEEWTDRLLDNDNLASVMIVLSSLLQMLFQRQVASLDPAERKKRRDTLLSDVMALLDDGAPANKHLSKRHAPSIPEAIVGAEDAVQRIAAADTLAVHDASMVRWYTARTRRRFDTHRMVRNELFDAAKYTLYTIVGMLVVMLGTALFATIVVALENASPGQLLVVIKTIDHMQKQGY